MLLFTVGPVMMFPETLEESGRQLPYFRTGEFSRMMLESERLLKKHLRTSDSSKVAFLTASGTGAMEAAVANTFTVGDRLLIIDGGGFGRRFCEICDVHGIAYDRVALPFGKALSSEDLDPFNDTGYAGMLVNADETSTGQLYDLHMLSRFCKSKGMLLVVDAISSFLADPFDMDGTGIDVVILSSQKALSLSPGLSMVVMNESVYRDRVENGRCGMYYLDIKRHVTDQIRGQTPFTPAVDTLIELNTMLRMIDDMGVSEKVENTRRLACRFREGVKDLGLRIPDYPLSNAVTPVLFDGNAEEVYLGLRNNYDITVTPSGGELKPFLLRVGHLGNLSEADYDKLLDALKKLVK